MKFIILSLFLASSAMGSGLVNGTLSPVPGNGTNSGGPVPASQITGIIPVSVGGTGATNARAVGQNIGIAQWSAAGGGNYINDVFSATSAFEGQFALTYAGDKAPYLWVNGGSGIATNVTSKPLSIFGGLSHVGNDSQGSYYTEFTNQVDGDLIVYLMNGPYASSHFHATNGGYHQPYFNVFSGNGWSDQGAVCVQTVMTNNTYAGRSPTDVWATNIDGTVWYKPVWGLQFIEIGDAYLRGDASHNPEAQLGPCDIFALQSVVKMPLYGGMNAQLPGDSELGIRPWIAVSYSNVLTSGDAVVSFPRWIPNVWAFTNPAYLGTFNMHLGTGAWDATNGSGTISNLTILPIAKFKMARQSGQDDTIDFTVNTNASFNGDNIALTVDSSSSHRLGFVKKNASFPGLYAAKGSPLNIGHSSQSDLQASIGSATLTNDIVISATDGSVTMASNLTVNGTMAGNGKGITNLSANSDSYGTQSFTATTNLTIDFTTNGIKKVYLTLTGNVCFSNYVAAPGGTVTYFLISTATRDIYIPYALAAAGGISNFYNTNWISSLSGSNAVLRMTNGQQAIVYFDMSTNTTWAGISCVPSLR